MSKPLILIANPGSASRKYALFVDTRERVQLHFEYAEGTVVCTMSSEQKTEKIHTDITQLEDAHKAVLPILHSRFFLEEKDVITAIGLRIVAPGSYFLEDHKVDDAFISQLEKAKAQAPLHATASLAELARLQEYFPTLPIFGISDSSFHKTKPDHAWNYGISLELADKYDIKRFGYHGISMASVVTQLDTQEKLIVCHLGSGASITAIKDGLSKDTTMGYSPLEGIVMSTRSGSIDIVAALAIKKEQTLDDLPLEEYLNKESGLLGLGGSNDIRELLKREAESDARARLALNTYIYSIQKHIGQMVAALNGVDALVFTGTVGERSASIRKRIVSSLKYLGFSIDQQKNRESASQIQSPGSKQIYVIPTQEEKEMARHVALLTAK